MSESQKKDYETSPFKTPNKDTKTSKHISESPKNHSESPSQNERLRDISISSEKENLKKRKLLIDEDKENCENEFIRKEKETKLN
jgi:hypothetical protein